MDLVEQILSELEDLLNVIERTYDTYKKSPKTRLTCGYVTVKMQAIEDYWNQFRVAHNTLLKNVKKEQRKLLPYFVKGEYYVCEDLVIEAKANMNDLLFSLQSQQKSQQNVQQERSSTQAAQHTSVSQVKLPRIIIPKFFGNYDSWPTFRDLFASLVDGNNSISNVEKLHYLKTSVGGEAELLLRHIQINDANYALAWKTLQDRFSNKRLIATSLLKRMVNQRKLTTQNSTQLKSLIDTTSECLNSLKNMDVKTEDWDPLVNFLVVQKLDANTHKEWEDHVSNEKGNELPTFEMLKLFLESKFRTLELVQPTASPREKIVRTHHVSDNVAERACPMCNDKHALCHCKEFGKMEPEQRSEYVKTNKICYNCLVPGHGVKTCRLLTTCRLCKRRHHTLLHSKRYRDSCGQPENEKIQPKVLLSNVEEESTPEEEVNLAVLTSQTNTAHSTAVALLATALVECKSEDGHTTVLRALVDPGSQGCFISQRAAQTIRARRYPIKGSIVGVGEVKTRINQAVHIEIASRNESFSLKVKAYVISKQLTTQIPPHRISSNNWNPLEGLILADPQYNQPSNIDLLLGVNKYAQIIQNDIVKGPPGSPIAQKTTLGWILFGKINDSSVEEESLMVLHQQVQVDEMLKALWEIDVEAKRKLTKDEENCERIYKENYTRTEEGRYVVKLPFKTEKPQSPEGNTFNIAMKRLEMLERRFDRQPDLKKNYSEVIEEYIRLNHMQEIPQEELNKKSVYLPHHAVIRSDKETSKTRVVFDASCKGTNGISLNDELLTGPILQEDLRSIIMRWRMHKICFVSDIEKMYRMILVSTNDTDFQRVLWRDDTSTSDEVKHYRLLTVTFGTASAPYLAVKTLMQLAEDEGQNYPIAARMIREDYYVDDLMSGCDSVEEAIEASNQLKTVLSKGKFRLQKWCSNNSEFLRSLDETERTTRAHIDMKLDGVVKALGVTWNLGEDVFNYSLTLKTLPIDVTKRSVLSDLQKLFDPLGWIAPTIVLAKIFVQKLWLQGVGWHDILDNDLQAEWKSIRYDLQNVNNIKIPRWLNTVHALKDNISLHGYSDASMHAMAAVVYCRVVQSDGTVEVKIVAARTKVAPVKTISIPRLELCAAVLLSKLLSQTAQAMRTSIDNVFAYTDSSVVLSWLSGEPSRWKQFVANRVVEICNTIPNSRWFHVQTDKNPADVASRGAKLSELKQNNLWWHGPVWLHGETITLSKPNVEQTEIEKKKINILGMNIVKGYTQDKEVLNFENYCNLEELQKVIIYMRRFLNYKRSKECTKAITTNELDKALKICIKKAQEDDFKEDIEAIQKYNRVKRNSYLKSLNPYLDEEHILRVGGRLRHANLEKDTKHPIILSNKNLLTSLIVADAHQKTLHGGLQLMLCYLRSRFWILKAKGIVKRHIHRCVICARANAKARSQMMGNLPDMRVNKARPFLYSGVDFAGPFNVLMSKGRGAKTNKAYISIFICMCTKALHLELVGDMTTDAFLAAFRRFVARRGRCAHIYSDQGRNFIGANKELIEAWKAAQFELKENVAQTLALDNTQWHFIPPYSPNFGGLWEAGVKSVKMHLKKTLTSNLTFEEFTTLLCQIESCLNSRPLIPIDDTDTTNLSPLTPSHFLIGETATEVPTPDLTNLNINYLSRWQHIQRLLQSFWKRWQSEYLTRLQERPKWLRRQKEFNINGVVLIKQDGLPPGKWLMGRIVTKHPGPDGNTRVYSVKSGDHITKRCVTKLCPLINSKDEYD